MVAIHIIIVVMVSNITYAKILPTATVNNIYSHNDNSNTFEGNC